MTEAARILAQVFGHDEFREGQEAVVKDTIAGHDVLAVMPTGGGKSVCFQVPALIRGGVTIAISPLLALMKEQVKTLRSKGVQAHELTSTTSKMDTERAWRNAQEGDATILYMSPERATRKETVERLKKLDVRLLAVDEAHCISQWGPSFRPDYERLREIRAYCPKASTIALTATADATTREDITRQLLNNSARVHVMSFDRKNIHLKVSSKRDWKEQIEGIVRQREEETGIVYCLSRARTQACADHLRAEGFDARVYHAGLSTREREQGQERFMEEKPMVMCATIAFGMGIDKPNVRYIAHADLPGNIEAYYQEIGRAGRDGDRAQAITLFSVRDIEVRRRMIENEPTTDKRKAIGHRKFDALLDYCESLTCRRQKLLEYFGEESRRCGNCDVCTERKTRSGSEQGSTSHHRGRKTHRREGKRGACCRNCGRQSDKTSESARAQSNQGVRCATGKGVTRGRIVGETNDRTRSAHDRCDLWTTGRRTAGRENRQKTGRVRKPLHHRCKGKAKNGGTTKN